MRQMRTEVFWVIMQQVVRRNYHASLRNKPEEHRFQLPNQYIISTLFHFHSANDMAAETPQVQCHCKIKFPHLSRKSSNCSTTNMGTVTLYLDYIKLSFMFSILTPYCLVLKFYQHQNILMIWTTQQHKTVNKIPLLTIHLKTLRSQSISSVPIHATWHHHPKLENTTSL
jgi:hypothetical protein